MGNKADRKHRIMRRLAGIKPTRISVRRSEAVNERVAKRFSRAWALKEKVERREEGLLAKTARGVKPYRNIDDMFLPDSSSMEAVNNIPEYMTQDHGGRSEASASRLRSSGCPNNYLDVMSDAEEFRKDVINKIEQMMYVSGETGEPSAETTGMIEEIVRQQVVEIVSPPCTYHN